MNKIDWFVATAILIIVTIFPISIVYQVGKQRGIHQVHMEAASKGYGHFDIVYGTNGHRDFIFNWK